MTRVSLYSWQQWQHWKFCQNIILQERLRWNHLASCNNCTYHSSHSWCGTIQCLRLHRSGGMVTHVGRTFSRREVRLPAWSLLHENLIGKFHIPCVPRSTQPCTLHGTVNEYQLSGWVIINGDGPMVDVVNSQWWDQDSKGKTKTKTKTVTFKTKTKALGFKTKTARPRQYLKDQDYTRQ